MANGPLVTFCQTKELLRLKIFYLIPSRNVFTYLPVSLSPFFTTSLHFYIFFDCMVIHILCDIEDTFNIFKGIFVYVKEYQRLRKQKKRTSD